MMLHSSFVVLLLICVSVEVESSSMFNMSVTPFISSPPLSALDIAGSISYFTGTSCTGNGATWKWSGPSGSSGSALCGGTCLQIANQSESFKAWCGQSSTETSAQIIDYQGSTSCSSSGTAVITYTVVANKGPDVCMQGTTTFNGVTKAVGFMVNCGSGAPDPASSIEDMCSSSSNTAMVIGISVAIVVVVVIILVGYWYYRKTRNAAIPPRESHPAFDLQGRTSIPGQYQPPQAIYQPPNLQYPQYNPGNQAYGRM